MHAEQMAALSEAHHLKVTTLQAQATSAKALADKALTDYKQFADKLLAKYAVPQPKPTVNRPDGPALPVPERTPALEAAVSPELSDVLSQLHAAAVSAGASQ
jgi:hypothetical protein